jgi:hypothetical protein
MRRFARGAPALLLSLGLVACNANREPAPAAEPAESLETAEAPAAMPPPGSEAARTAEMEERQAEMNRKLEDAKASWLSQEELDQAYRDYEAERLELNRAAEGAPPAPDEASAAADYPPPPL